MRPPPGSVIVHAARPPIRRDPGHTGRPGGRTRSLGRRWAPLARIGAQVIAETVERQGRSSVEATRRAAWEALTDTLARVELVRAVNEAAERVLRDAWSEVGQFAKDATWQQHGGPVCGEPKDWRERLGRLRTRVADLDEATAVARDHLGGDCALFPDLASGLVELRARVSAFEGMAVTRRAVRDPRVATTAVPRGDLTRRAILRTAALLGDAETLG